MVTLLRFSGMRVLVKVTISVVVIVAAGEDAVERDKDGVNIVFPLLTLIDVGEGELIVLQLCLQWQDWTAGAEMPLNSRLKWPPIHHGRWILMELLKVCR